MWAQIVLVVALIAVGFFAGRKTIKVPDPKVVIEYVTLPAVHDSIDRPVPYLVQAKIDTEGVIRQCIADGIYSELWPERIVTEYVEVTKEDSTKIMEDWASRRLYSEKLMESDTLGTLTVDAAVQYNRLSSMSYTYVPVQKQTTTTVYVIKKFSPFVQAGATFPLGDNPDVVGDVGAGIFFKEKFGVMAKYQHSFYGKTDYLGGGILVKF